MQIDILDYVGKHEGGILSLISINYEGEYYQGYFYYQQELLALTVEDSLEEKLGCIIEDWDGYNDLMIDIIKKVVPYDELINRIDDFDPEKYGLYFDQSSSSSSNSS